MKHVAGAQRAAQVGAPLNCVHFHICMNCVLQRVWAIGTLSLNGMRRFFVEVPRAHE
jgi:hypothetical protein